MAGHKLTVHYELMISTDLQSLYLYNFELIQASFFGMAYKYSHCLYIVPLHFKLAFDLLIQIVLIKFNLLAIVYTLYWFLYFFALSLTRVRNGKRA